MNKSLNGVAGIIIWGIVFIWGVGLGMAWGKIDSEYYIHYGIFVIFAIISSYGTSVELRQDPNNPKIKKDLMTKIFLWIVGIFVVIIIGWALLSLYIIQR